MSHSAAGWRFNAMALLANGWHMSSQAVAIGLSAAAYATTRRHAGDTRMADLHVWRVGQRADACAMTVVTYDRALTADRLRQRLSVHA